MKRVVVEFPESEFEALRRGLARLYAVGDDGPVALRGALTRVIWAVERVAAEGVDG